MFIFIAFKNLFRNTRRTIAILLTVALGAGALFSFDGFIKGMLDQYRDDTIHSHYGFGQINTKNYREKVYQEPWKHWIKNTDQVVAYLSELDEVEQVFPRVSFSALLTKDKNSVSGSGQGIDAKKESEFFHSLKLIEGKPLLDQPYGIILGKGLANALDAKPGDTVTVTASSSKSSVQKLKLEVAGIFETGSQDYDSRMFKIQLQQAQNLLRTTNVELFSLGLKDISHWKKVERAVEKKFPQLEATSFAVLDEVYYQHSVDWLNAQYRVVQVIILSIVLLGIFNTISAAILERKQEIGNLRANGESRLNVMQLIVTEGTFLGILGGAAGIAFSYFILMAFLNKGVELPPGPGMTRQAFVTFAFEGSMVTSTLALSTIAAIIASILAGLKVARMPIASALRAY